MPQPAEVGALADELISVYRRAWDSIEAEQASIADNPKAWRRRARLNELRRAVEASMDDVDGQAAQWFSTRFPEAYGRGAADLGRQLGNVPFAWASPDLDAVAEMAQDGFDDLLRATTHVRQTTKDLVRTLARERSLLKLTTGQTARQAGADLRRVLDEHKISAITYKDGSRHGLGEYADLIVRSKSANAYNGGAINFGVRNGIEWFEVFDGADCGWIGHDDMDKANGSIRSAQECAQATISHPRCRRSVGPRPDLTERDVTGARASTTVEQRVDQRASEQRREATNLRRSQRRARQRREAERAARRRNR